MGRKQSSRNPSQAKPQASPDADDNPYRAFTFTEDVLPEATLQQFPGLTADDIRGLTMAEIRQLWLQRRAEARTTLPADPVKRRRKQAKRGPGHPVEYDWSKIDPFIDDEIRRGTKNPAAVVLALLKEKGITRPGVRAMQTRVARKRSN